MLKKLVHSIISDGGAVADMCALGSVGAAGRAGSAGMVIIFMVIISW
jgi:hypothetical protein